MSETFELKASLRTAQGTRANRRLRRQNMVPGVLYGAGDSVPIQIDAFELASHLKVEAFYSHILELDLDGKKESVILRDLQRHPSKDAIIHMDLLRISKDQEIRIHVPLHYLNEGTCVGVKEQGGIVSHLHTSIEITCLPKDLPEYIEVDIQELKIGESLHFSDIPFPEGVKAPMAHGDEAIVSITVPRAAAAAEEEALAAEAEGEEATEEGKAEESAEKEDKSKS